MQKEIQALTKLELFEELGYEQLQMIVFASTQKTTPQGHLIFRQGDRGSAAYLILSGRASLLSILSTGEEHVQEYSNNALLGESALFSETPYVSTARALTDVETLVIPREVFMRMLTSFPDAAIKVTSIIQKRLDSTLGDLNQFKSDLIQNKF